MLFEELLREREKEGRLEGQKEGRLEGQKEGREEGIQVILKLTSAMTAAGEAGQIPRLSDDPAFLEEMLAKYHL